VLGTALTTQRPSIIQSVGTLRLTSLDVFRGMMIAAMIIVNDPGDLSHTYAPLRHAIWERITPTDMVFPFFLFIVGVALAAALRPYWASDPDGRRVPDRALYTRLVRRAALLIALGLLVNGSPSFNVETWRIPGVLQRIAICFVLAALIVLHVPQRWQWGIGAVILGGYAAMLRFVGAPGVTPGQLEPTANLPRWVDLAVFSQKHVFQWWPTEPEGLLSTPAAVVSVLIGCWVGYGVLGRSPARRRGAVIIGCGMVSVAAGLLWSTTLPMIKMIWTPSYVLFSGGWAMVAFGLCYLLTDVKSSVNPMWVVQVFGRNAILAYVVSELTASTLSAVRVRGTPFPQFATVSMVSASGGVLSAEMGSLLYALLFTFAIWMALYIPYRYRWFLRV
jgi:predicted acyltransferase